VCVSNTTTFNVVIASLTHTTFHRIFHVTNIHFQHRDCLYTQSVSQSAVMYSKMFCAGVCGSVWECAGVCGLRAHSHFRRKRRFNKRHELANFQRRHQVELLSAGSPFSNSQTVRTHNLLDKIDSVIRLFASHTHAVLNRHYKVVNYARNFSRYVTSMDTHTHSVPSLGQRDTMNSQ